MSRKSKVPKIPEEDMKDINTAFSGNRESEAITKDRVGNKIGRGAELVDSRGFVIKDFRGRTLIQNKSLIPVGGRQIIIGKKGQLFDDIPEAYCSRINWSESDFEKKRTD